ncbi:hypothetical protein M2G37_22065, partial [Vibrio vulnificus]|nr:hypothetical protein [Vibrio vulnificus]
MVLVVKVVCG